jgi:glucokinase
MSSRVSLAIDLGGTNVRAALVDSEGNILARKMLPTSAGDGAAQILQRIIEVSRAVIATDSTPAVIGMGSPGCIDADTGRVLFATDNLPGWRGTDLKSILQDEFALPAFIDNDVNMMAFGESRTGAGKGIASLVCLTLGTGVGGAIILDRKVYRGHQFYSGEMGHLSINFEGPECNCGGRGCLEAYIGTTAILDKVKRLKKNGVSSLVFDLADKYNREVTPQVIFEAASAGDEAALSIFKEMGYYLGFGLGSLINVVSPEAIVIGGGISQAWDFFYPSLVQSLRSQALFGSERTVKIVPAKLGPDAGLIGSGLYALEQAGI